MKKASEALRAAHRVTFFTGAGISAESGIATFRDKLTGLWEKHDPKRLETAEAFRENPSLVWGWYLWRRREAGLAHPNPAHFAVQRVADSDKKVFVVTQNIDDLHERAGSHDVIHLHGSLSTPKCVGCRRTVELTAEQATVFGEGEPVDPPRCERCQGRLRPGIVWFGENLPASAWKSALQAVKSCEVLISVGTSGFVAPAADIPEIALAAGATVIHVNLSDVSLGGEGELMLLGRATVVLRKLLVAAGIA